MPVRPSFAASVGETRAAGPESVLQPRVLVIDVADDPDLAFQCRAFFADPRRMFGRQVARDAARYHVVHGQPVAEGDEVGAQHVLLQSRKLRQAEREAAVVAKVAQVAQVVGEALAFQRERAQPCGAGGMVTSAMASSACA